VSEAGKALKAATWFIEKMECWERKWGVMAQQSPLEFAKRSEEIEEELRKIFNCHLSSELLATRQSRLDMLMPSIPPEYAIRAVSSELVRGGKRAVVNTNSTHPFSPSQLLMLRENGEWKIDRKVSTFEDGTKRATKWI
jgi:hypothetical protein